MGIISTLLTKLGLKPEPPKDTYEPWDADWDLVDIADNPDLPPDAIRDEYKTRLPDDHQWTWKEIQGLTKAEFRIHEQDIDTAINLFMVN